MQFSMQKIRQTYLSEPRQSLIILAFQMVIYLFGITSESPDALFFPMLTEQSTNNSRLFVVNVRYQSDHVAK